MPNEGVHFASRYAKLVLKEEWIKLAQNSMCHSNPTPTYQIFFSDLSGDLKVIGPLIGNGLNAASHDCFMLAVVPFGFRYPLQTTLTSRTKRMKRAFCKLPF